MRQYWKKAMIQKKLIEDELGDEDWYIVLEDGAEIFIGSEEGADLVLGLFETIEALERRQNRRNKKNGRTPSWAELEYEDSTNGRRDRKSKRGMPKLGAAIAELAG